MGFLDSLFGGKKSGGDKEKKAKKLSPRELARLSKLAGQKLAQNYDRQEAIEELARQGTADAATGLLRRFTFTMEPSITDQEEKEMAAEGIVAAGAEAIEPIRVYCKKAESLTWPLRVLRNILDEEEFVDEVLAILDQFDIEYVRNPEPKIQLLNALEEHPSDDVRLAIEPFLQDMSEPVRFSAVITVFNMEDEESAAALAEALAEEESLRVCNRICSGLAERGWTIPEDLREGCMQGIPDGYALRDGVVVQD